MLPEECALQVTSETYLLVAFCHIDADALIVLIYLSLLALLMPSSIPFQLHAEMSIHVHVYH